jgi:hypothetical protein
MLLQQIERCLVTSFAIGHNVADDHLRSQQRWAVISSGLKALFRGAICGGRTGVICRMRRLLTAIALCLVTYA